MSQIGNNINAYSFGANDTKTVSNIKSENIADLIAQLQEAEKTATHQTEWGIAETIKRIFASQAQRQQQAKQEVGSIDRFYDGSLEGELAGIRARRGAAYRDSTDRALAGIRKGKNLGLLSGDTTGGSYFDRIALGSSRDAEIAAALDAVNQEKADLNYLTGNQVNLAGRRGEISDAALMRLLIPGRLRTDETRRRLGMTGGINDLDKSNTFYGLREELDTTAKIAGVANEMWTGYLEYMGTSKGGNNPSANSSYLSAATPQQQNAVRNESMYGYNGGYGGTGGGTGGYFDMNRGGIDYGSGGGSGMGGGMDMQSFGGGGGWA